MNNYNPFKDLAVRAGDVQRSVNWYRSQVQNLRNVNSSISGMLSGQVKNLRANIVPGGLYLFQYDALHKDKLPYWDAMPLVFPFRTVPGGFLGLNLHYLPYGLRFQLMGALIDVRAQTNSPDTQHLISWQLLNSSSKFPGVQACVKHYLKAQVRSRFMNIPQEQWLSASMLPIEQFQGADKSAVWRQSRKYI
jgi:hypothetical protein